MINSALLVRDAVFYVREKIDEIAFGIVLTSPIGTTITLAVIMIIPGCHKRNFFADRSVFGNKIGFAVLFGDRLLLGRACINTFTVHHEQIRLIGKNGFPKRLRLILVSARAKGHAIQSRFEINTSRGKC
ncbi:hypothetical protein D3C72_2030890 [compost metagenome]